MLNDFIKFFERFMLSLILILELKIKNKCLDTREKAEI